MDGGESEVIRKEYLHASREGLAARLGVTEGPLAQQACRMGLSKPVAHHLWTEQDRETILREYPYTTRAELAAKLGVAERALAAQLARMGIKKLQRREWTPEDLETIRREYPHTTRRELAAKLGVTESALAQLVQREGLQKRSDSHKWTSEELEILKREYRNTRESVSELADKIGVSEMAVKWQVARLGMCKDVRWTPEEDRALFNLVGRYRTSTIARKLGRSLEAVQHRAQRLGVSLQDRTGWYTQDEVAEILGVNHHWVKTRIDNGTLKVQWTGTRIGPHRRRRISRRALRTFIRRYAHELVGKDYDLLEVVDVLAGLDVRV